MGIAPKKYTNVMIVATRKIINYKNSGFNKGAGENLVILKLRRHTRVYTMAELNNVIFLIQIKC